MSRRLRLSLLAVPVLGVSLAAGLWLQSPPSPAPSGSSVAGTERAPAPSALPALRREMVAGREHLYTLHMTQATSAQAASGDDGASDVDARGGLLFQVEIAGELSLTATDVGGRGAVVRAAFDRVSFSMKQGAEEVLPPGERGAIERALTEGAFVEMSGEGLVRGYHFPKSAAPLARTVLRSVIAATQPVLAADASPTWETVEGDTGGEYTVFYRRSGPAAFTRRKGEYRRITSPKGLVPPGALGSVVAAGTGTFALAEDGWVQKMSGSETVTAEATMVQQVSLTRVDATLALSRVSERPDLVSAFERARGTLERTGAAENDLARAAAREMDAKTVAGARPGEVLSRLGTLRAKDSVARADGKDQLAAMVRLDGRAATELSNAVREGLSPEDAATVVGALASAGTREAESALAEIALDEHLGGSLRADATMALATGEEVSPAGIATLKRLSESGDRDVRSAGSLGMGAAAKTLAEGSDDASEDLVTTLLARLASASSDAERATLFEALGNSGDVRLIPLVEAALVSAVPPVRAAALLALRHVQDDRADVLLAATLVADPERMVRNTALLAMSFRVPERHVPSLAAHLRIEPMKSLRMASVAQLGKWRSVPGAASLLLDVMKNDADAEVRAAAEALLDG